MPQEPVIRLADAGLYCPAGDFFVDPWEPVERAVKKPGRRAVGKRSGDKDPNVTKLELDLSERLGAPVTIEQSGSGGKLTVRYTSVDELEGILAHIR